MSTDPNAYIEVLARLLCAADVHVHDGDHPTWQQLRVAQHGRGQDDYRKAATWLQPKLTVAAETRLSRAERRCDELRAESKRRGRNVLEQSEKIRALEREIDGLQAQLGAEILQADQAAAAPAAVPPADRAADVYVTMLGEYPTGSWATLEEAQRQALEGQTMFQPPGRHEHRWDDKQRPGEIWRLMEKRVGNGNRFAWAVRSVHLVPGQPAAPAVLPADSEPHRLALSTALSLGTSAPWDAIRERATELAADRSGWRAAAVFVEAMNEGCGRAKPCASCDAREDAAAELRRVTAETPQAETEASASTVVCEGFQWIGQSFATCDRCGQPAWEHAGEDVAVEGAGPFDTRRTVRPWKPGEADAIRAKWGTPAVVAQPAKEADSAAVLLSSQCDACSHTLNWHRNDVGCTVALCVCSRFQPAEEA